MHQRATSLKTVLQNRDRGWREFVAYICALLSFALRACLFVKHNVERPLARAHYDLSSSRRLMGPNYVRNVAKRLAAAV